ncbi:DUF397 domain-containing protein [Nocardiopsis sp. CNT-189]|uniref:DUF397 domain-containing protein n=1 Tax=Nocardiopsis oceanisediminis TaxID=2816862 RepID=UPI003B317431
MTHDLVFGKSNYSGQGVNCVEVATIPADFHKSSYSGGTGGNCVEVASIPADFRKSSYSGDTGGNCIEVGSLPCGAAVRDSRHPEDGFIAVPAKEWAFFLRTAQAEAL